MDKPQVAEEMLYQIPLNNPLQDLMLIMNLDLPQDLIGLLELIKILRMQRFQVLTSEKTELVEEHQKISIQKILTRDHLQKVLTHPLLERRDQEITAQDLMINTNIFIC